jgi:hypothetical protein
MLSAAGSGPKANPSASDWADMVDGFQKKALESRLGIPLIYGIDAIHGNNSIYGATIFPHNVGLGATRLMLITLCPWLPLVSYITGLFFFYFFFWEKIKYTQGKKEKENLKKVDS